MINVYNDEYRDEVVARVKYNDNLDHWDGQNWTNGGVGRHLGITKLKDGSYVLIYGTQWQGQEDYGLVVSKEEALKAILKSGNNELLDNNKYKELKELADKILIEEDKEKD